MAGAEKVILRCGGYQGESSVHTRALRIFAAEVGRAGIGVELTPNITERGHRAVELLGMVERSELDLCYFSSSYLAHRVPGLCALDLPFLVTDRSDAYRKLDDVLGRRLADTIAERTGFHALSFWDNGFRHITNRLHPIRRPQDCLGMKLRTLDNALHQEIFRALGFDPIVIDVKDLPAAVRSGSVDAQENPLTNTVNFNLHRSHRHISLTSHFFGVALVLVNRASFENWSADARRLICAAAQIATSAQRRFAANEDVDCLARLRDDGCQIVPADAIDLAAFKAAVSGISRREMASIDPVILAAL